MKNILSSVIGHSKTKNRLVDLIGNNKLPNTIILSGNKSIGKFKVALGLSQVIMCSQRINKQACGQCGDCIRSANKQHEGLLIVESSSGLIKVDEARRVTQFFSKKNNPNEFRVVIIDEAELLNSQSANALLKTLEEPPQNCFILLVTSSLYRLLPTIRSRGQIFRFGQLSIDEIKQVTKVEDWLIRLSGLNIDTIDKLQEASFQDIYMKLASGIAELKEANYNHWINQILPYTKNKNQSLVLIQALQGLLYSTYKLKLGYEFQVLDWQIPSVDRLKTLSNTILMDLFKEATKMEQQLKANFDILLIFESFYLKLISLFEQGASHAGMDRHTHTS